MAETFGELKKGEYFIIAESVGGRCLRKKISKTHQVNLMTGERNSLNSDLKVHPVHFEPYMLMKEIIKALKP